MKTLLAALIATVMALISTPVLAKGKTSFLPENDLYLEDNVNFTASLTETDFNDVINYIQYVYEPIIAKFGANLVIEGDWADSTVNAYAETIGNVWHVQMFGGLARRKEVSVLGFGMVIAHELCHHVGGFPVYMNWNDNGASNEGNSDYCATALVGKQIFASGEFSAKFKLQGSADNIDPLARALCEKYFYYSTVDRTSCFMSMDASQSLANLLAALGGERVPKVGTPDKTQVPKTSDTHPRAQCRLDTMVAGAACAAVWNPLVIPENEVEMRANSCTVALDQVRPRCFFRPQQ